MAKVVSERKGGLGALDIESTKLMPGTTRAPVSLSHCKFKGLVFIRQGREQALTSFSITDHKLLSRFGRFRNMIEPNRGGR